MDWEGADTARVKQEVSSRCVHKWTDLGRSYVTAVRLLHPGIVGAHRRAPFTTVPCDTPSKVEFSPYEFLPFGSGIRRCIGEDLALFEMKLVLAKIVSQYQLTLAQQQPERPQRRGINLAPSTGVRLIMQGKR